MRIYREIRFWLNVREHNELIETYQRKERKYFCSYYRNKEWKGVATSEFLTLRGKKSTISKSSLCVSFHSFIQQILQSKFCVHGLPYGTCKRSNKNRQNSLPSKGLHSSREYRQ